MHGFKYRKKNKFVFKPSNLGVVNYMYCVYKM